MNIIIRKVSSLLSDDIRSSNPGISPWMGGNEKSGRQEEAKFAIPEIQIAHSCTGGGEITLKMPKTRHCPLKGLLHLWVTKPVLLLSHKLTFFQPLSLLDKLIPLFLPLPLHPIHLQTSPIFQFHPQRALFFHLRWCRWRNLIRWW